MKKSDKALIITAAAALVFIVATIGVTAIFSPRRDASSLDSGSKGKTMSIEIDEPVRSVVIEFPDYGDCELTVCRAGKSSVSFPGEYNTVMKTEVNDGVLTLSFPDDFEEYFAGKFTVSLSDEIESITQTGMTNMTVSGFRQKSLVADIASDLFLEQCVFENLNIGYTGYSWQDFNITGKSSVVDKLSVNSESSDICITTLPTDIKNNVTVVSSEPEVTDDEDDDVVVVEDIDITVKFVGPQPKVVLRGTPKRQIGMYYDHTVMLPAVVDSTAVLE